MINKAGLSMAAILALSACNLGNSTGYVPTATEISTISINSDTAADIEGRFGRPTVVGERNNVWYYISQRRAYPGPLPTREVDRQILAVTFDQNGVVRAVDRYDRSAGQNIAISSTVTPTIGNKPTLFEDVLNSVGRLSPEQIFANIADDN